MIKELIEFTKQLEDKGIHLSEYITPPEGLHFLMHYNFENGAIAPVHEQLIRVNKKTGLADGPEIHNEIQLRAMHTNPVDSNKSISDKKILSASPFAFRLKKQSLEDVKWMGNDFATQVPRYFREAIRKCKVELSEEQQPALDAFIAFCNGLSQFLADNKTYAALKPVDNIVLYLDNFSPEEYRQANGRYQGENLFNKADYNVEGSDGQLYGLSGFFNGDNQKKPYLQHQTASFSIGSRISQEEAQWLNQFDLLRRYGAFTTRPLPVFIDQPELNAEAVSVLKAAGNESGIHKLMKELAEGRKDDIGNYYLFYILAGELRDVDYIPKFRYHMENVFIEPLFISERKGEKWDEATPLPVRNIFELEKTLLVSLFNNQLVSVGGENAPMRYRYFDDLDFDPKYQTPALYEMLIRYRKPWYDYIYKSRVSAVSRELFHQIVREGILDDLRHDEWNAEKGFHTQEINIRKKLNRWFSFWDYFNYPQNSSISKTTTMPEKITSLRERIQAIAYYPKESFDAVKTDDEFAFAAGQLIYALTSQSKADKPNHGVLIPFIQKGNGKQLQLAIAKEMEKYLYNIDILKGKGPFEKIAAGVMSYEYPGNISDLVPMIIAGYFSKSFMKRDDSSSSSQTEENN